MAKKPKIITPLKTPKSIELEYYKELKKLANEMKKDVNEILLPALQGVSLDSKYTKDVGVNELLSAMALLQNKYSNITAFSTRVASNLVNKLNQLSGNKFNKSLESAYGVDVGRMVNQNKLNDLVALQRQKNQVLIKSIPSQFFNDIELIIQNGVANGLTYKSIANQIKGVEGITSTFGKLDNRVKLIARQETNVITSNLNNARASSAGITKAKWQTSNDDRVRDSHADRDGEVYDLSEGCYSSIDGKYLQVGQDFNCRCVCIYIIPED